MTDRIYRVSGGGIPHRLVRAASQSQAVNHVVKGTYKARVAQQSDLVELLPAGVVVESAIEETE